MRGIEGEGAAAGEVDWRLHTGQEGRFETVVQELDVLSLIASDEGRGAGIFCAINFPTQFEIGLLERLAQARLVAAPPADARREVDPGLTLALLESRLAGQ